MQMFSKFNRKSTSASWFGQQHPGISPVFSDPIIVPPTIYTLPRLRRSTSFGQLACALAFAIRRIRSAPTLCHVFMLTTSTTCH
jgi:hypothetical protein